MREIALPKPATVIAPQRGLRFHCKVVDIVGEQSLPQSVEKLKVICYGLDRFQMLGSICRVLTCQFPHLLITQLTSKVHDDFRTFTAVFHLTGSGRLLQHQMSLLQKAKPRDATSARQVIGPGSANGKKYSRKLSLRKNFLRKTPCLYQETSDSDPSRSPQPHLPATGTKNSGNVSVDTKCSFNNNVIKLNDCKDANSNNETNESTSEAKSSQPNVSRTVSLAEEIRAAMERMERREVFRENLEHGGTPLDRSCLFHPLSNPNNLPTSLLGAAAEIANRDSAEREYESEKVHHLKRGRMNASVEEKTLRPMEKPPSPRRNELEEICRTLNVEVRGVATEEFQKRKGDALNIQEENTRSHHQNDFQEDFQKANEQQKTPRGSQRRAVDSELVEAPDFFLLQTLLLRLLYVVGIHAFNVITADFFCNPKTGVFSFRAKLSTTLLKARLSLLSENVIQDDMQKLEEDIRDVLLEHQAIHERSSAPDRSRSSKCDNKHLSRTSLSSKKEIKNSSSISSLSSNHTFSWLPRPSKMWREAWPRCGSSYGGHDSTKAREGSEVPEEWSNNTNDSSFCECTDNFIPITYSMNDESTSVWQHFVEKVLGHHEKDTHQNEQYAVRLSQFLTSMTCEPSPLSHALWLPSYSMSNDSRESCLSTAPSETTTLEKLLLDPTSILGRIQRRSLLLEFHRYVSAPDMMYSGRRLQLTKVRCSTAEPTTSQLRLLLLRSLPQRSNKIPSPHEKLRRSFSKRQAL